MPPQAEGTRREAGGDDARRVNVPLGQRFAQTAPSYNAEARTVEIVIATETLVRMPGWFLGINEDYYFEVLDCSDSAVDFSEVRAGNVPLLDAHSRWSVKDQLGKVTEGRCENNQVVIMTALGQSQAAKDIEAEIAAGTPPKASAGYRREQVIFERFEGETPVYRVTKWTLREASFVPIAADPNAGVRSAEQIIFPCVINEGARAMPPEQNVTAAGAAATTTTAAQTTGATALVAPQPDATRGALDSGKPGIVRFTGSRAMAFVEMARSFGDTVVTRARALIEQNEKGEISVETANAELLKASAEAQRAATSGVGTGGSGITVTADERDKFLRGAENAIIQRAGVGGIIARAAEARGQKLDLDPGEFRGIRNAELARMTLERAGHKVDTHDRDRIVGEALSLRMGPFQSTSDFPVLLEGVMHRTLQAAFVLAPDTWRQFAGTGSVSDFRPHHRYLRGTFGTLDQVLEDGEFKNKPIPDGARESISAVTKGNIVGLTRQAIVNDDLGAFNQIAVELGRGAKLSIEVDVYRLLALNNGLGPVMNDGKTLFHADHGNIVTPAGAPSVATFSALDTLMATQKDLSGNEYIEIKPSVLLVPRAMRGEALVINDSKYDPEAKGALERPNTVRGLFDTVVGSPRLSGTRQYAFADPAIAPAIEVAFLNGEQEPFLDSREGWRVDGIEWKVRLDYGVGAVNWRAAATNAGAA